MAVIWVGQGHAGQRDLIRLMRAGLGPDATVVASHAEDREDTLSDADIALRTLGTPDPALHGTAFAEWLLGAAQAMGASVVLVHRFRRAVVAARPAFEAAGVKVSGGALRVEDLDATKRKDLFTQTLDGIGVPVPRTVAVTDGAQLRRAVLAIGASREVCVKPVIGVFGRGFWRLSDVPEISAFLEPDQRVASAAAFMRAYEAAEAPEPYLVMEWLPGTEFSIDCVCDAGRVIAAASRRKEVGYQVIETRGPQVDLARRVVEVFTLDGLVNVQVRLDVDGRPCVLEVNTRPSGGLTYSAAAGVNLPGAWARHVTGLPVHVPDLAAPVAVRVVETAVRLPDISRWLAAA